MTKRLISILLILSYLMAPNTSLKAESNGFSDVPLDHWAYGDVQVLRELNVTEGVGNNNFGLGQQITRAEFTVFLVKLMNWALISGEGAYEDNRDANVWYYPYVETALANGAINLDAKAFRPGDAITRGEIAVMLVRALGYDSLGAELEKLSSPFSDVVKDKGYILMAKDLGIISGYSDGRFLPDNTAAREEAAAMMVRMYRINQKLEAKTEFLNGFYAIRSADQMNLITNFDTVSFGWSRLDISEGNVDVFLNMSGEAGNEYCVPPGFKTPFDIARNSGKTVMLMVASNQSYEIVTNPELRKKAIYEIAQAVTSYTKDGVTVSFDGVVVDLENMKGEQAKQGFNSFLRELSAALEVNGKLMYVAVQPQRRDGLEYFDAYDYKTIGQLADKVILMAHDYNAKSLTDAEMAAGVTVTPLSPIDEVYYALKAITDRDTGVADRSKIVLQISFDIAQWKTQNGQTIHKTPYSPTYDALNARIAQGGVSMNYAERYESPYVTFYNSEDGTDNTAWYEDARSVEAKIRLAKLFDITGISLWRLGNIPDFNDRPENYLNVFQYIVNH